MAAHPQSDDSTAFSFFLHRKGVNLSTKREMNADI